MVSKRTIDYYTSIGLLTPTRSKSNYRIYSDDTLLDLKFIEECKELHFPLDEIKRKLEMKKAKNIRYSEAEQQISSLTQQMKQLESELSVVIPVLDSLDETKKGKLMKKLVQQGSTLMESLLNMTK